MTTTNGAALRDLGAFQLDSVDGVEGPQRFCPDHTGEPGVGTRSTPERERRARSIWARSPGRAAVRPMWSRRRDANASLTLGLVLWDPRDQVGVVRYCM